MTDAAVAPSSAADAGVRSLFLRAPDGLKLHLRDYGLTAVSDRLPVVCLPGLARTAADFDVLARALSSGEEPRRVLALDYRGRGLSEHDPDWRRYDVRVELADVLSILDALGITRAVLVGTSRGGLISMAMSAARPALIAGVVLNDIGPVIETQGLLRIRGYVGKLPQPRSWPEAADILRRLTDGQFPAIPPQDWTELARLTWREGKDGLELCYDPALLKTVETLDLERPLPPLWQFFDGLGAMPLLIVRGEHSDILSEDTLTEMQHRHPRIEIHHALGEGHAPFLRDEASIGRIADFVRNIT
ncbi:alpha/beta hydrolase [Agaricicola taiwanensis]|uniref:Alpha/beta hydrolase n=1 Tax=Agaricicola taiwanensis TaxID=591372 RepID=A0A8J2YJH0_9RHOB|nr:alpha/beta hydrolase [Agaricicola taiwanensis]GGE48151.1 alpha/beta hydrolase [Agaricicola taiwanensis]